LGGNKQNSGGVASMLRRLGDEHVRAIVTGGHDAEHLVRANLGDEAGSLLRALPPEDRADAASELFSRIAKGTLAADDAVSWLSIRVRRARQSLERVADAADRIKAERSRGGIASTATRRAPWQVWGKWIWKETGRHPGKTHPNYQKDIIRVIQARARGKAIKETERARRVPAGLPIILGKNGKPPSEKSIRRNLFDSRAKFI
jgi:hypothetical protein